MQKPVGIQPRFLNTDAAFDKIGPDETPYSRDIDDDISANPFNTGIGTANPTGEGQNFMSLSPVRSTVPIPVNLPPGYNLNIGEAFFELTNETYIFNYNSNGNINNHGVYVLNGDTMQWSTVIVDSALNFSNDPKYAIPFHRCRMRIIKDASGSIIEKYLVITDGLNWQKFFIVNAMIQTSGFNAGSFSYFSLLQPHFDRRELFELAPRPCLQKPTVTPVPYSSANTGLINRIIDKSFQFAISYQYTDGRTTTLGVYSNPFIIKSEIFLNNPNYLPKEGTLEFYAGSCMVEKAFIYVRQCGGTWALYDTIYKYFNSQDDSSNIIGTTFWTRTNPWSNYDYDPVYNTIQYVFDFSKVSTIIDQTTANRLQNDLPQVSIGMTDGGSALIMANNRYNYNNFDPVTLAKFDFSFQEQPSSGCNIPNRNIRLYAYCGRPGDRLSWESQVGYYLGSNTQFYFGGLQLGPSGAAEVNNSQSLYFNLNFADQESFRCYLKGTPYYSVGKWYIQNFDNSLTPVSGTYDFSDNDVLAQVQNVYLAGGMFVCVFDFVVPAGRYTACMARHNVASTGDWIKTSTYVIGLANSRSKRVSTFSGGNVTYLDPNFPGVIQTYEKEQEIDCTNGNVDVWGNGQDLFYIFCPYISTSGYRFIEGYLTESQDSGLGVEKFPYTMSEGSNTTGGYTDKNGFYFGFYRGPHADVCDMYFTVTLNCAYPVSFDVQTSHSGAGYCVNAPTYLVDHNGGVVGDCNRILVPIKIRSLDGAIPYSNIAISIVGGSVVYTDENGDATLIVHNGMAIDRVNNIYINSGGNFLITLLNCGYLPIYHFNSANAPCVICTVRTYPFPINLNVNVQDFESQSVKEGGSYSGAVWGMDLAGRLMFANIIGVANISTFMQRDETNPTSLVAFIVSSLKLNQKYTDLAYLAFGTSKDQTKLQYIQWVADSIQFIDNNGNVVTDASSAVFISISIQSLYNANVAKNFSTLSNYQFSQGDRVRFIDDGDSNLLTTSQYGDPIDLPILGENYNQAAITANLLPNPNTTPVVNVNNSITTQNTINTSSGSTSTETVATQQNNENITLYIAYDSRLNSLINNTGLWIEIYTPAQISDAVPYCETNVYPIINGEVAEFNGVDGSGQIEWNYPNSITLDFWDTYFLNRNINIPNVGSKNFSHPFESPNISDSFGASCSSCGRQNIKNDYVKQQFFPLDVIKGSDFVSDGLLNGLADFSSTNRKNFAQGYLWGGIIGCFTQGSVILFICENNSFATNFNFQYVFANAQGVQVANLDNQISEPMEKIARGYGCAMEHTRSLLFFDRFAFFYDYKNEAFVMDDYRSGQDISQLMVKSYFKAKTAFVMSWNSTSPLPSNIDVITGVDGITNKVYVTFRARQNNSTNPLSFINNKRNTQLNSSETMVYDIQKQRWRPMVGFTPEGYSMIKGKNSSSQMISFASGVPNLHNSSASFCNYYGQQNVPAIIGVFKGDGQTQMVLQNISENINPIPLFVDMIYSDARWSFSYIPRNYFRKIMDQQYATALRNMSSFKNPDPNQLFRSTLLDGRRQVGKYFVVRWVQAQQDAGMYFQLAALFALTSPAYPQKK